MWTGGVRVIVLDDKDRMLLVKQSHKERDVWMCPGGGIEEGEFAIDTARREMKEETGLDIVNCRMICHIQEVSERGQRFVNLFMADMADPNVKVELGYDPEFNNDEQVLSDIRFMSREEMQDLEALYPLYIRETFWEEYYAGKLDHDAFRKREE
ncbi:MAG: NUDIX hydrolase [Firmicutes bacterium]|nr:NUDIX hydrolase [Bacillota bacterium]